MRHRKYTFKIGRTSAHRRSLLANAVCSLIEHGRITTTLVKAKEIRRLADKMVTLGKEGTLHARRQAIAELHQVDKVGKLFSEIAPGFKERQGGYTRLMKLGPRIGDGAEMCILEFVENDEKAAAQKGAGAIAAAAAVEEAPAPAEAPAAAEEEAPKA
ncbi:MAG: 50S ribosomal protein L17 [Lentisphaerae bacterium]|jgi:large subunit ribosomal protein L17|nr:50S ribosomal protein L17 [Lentisphaerota bacterium]